MKKSSRGHGARNRRPIAAVGPALVLGLTAACGSAHAAYSCADLAAVTTADSTVTSAAPVVAGTTISGSVVAPVAMCRVQGVARPSSDSEIKWEVWLPDTAAAWTACTKNCCSFEQAKASERSGAFAVYSRRWDIWEKQYRIL